MNLKTGGRFTLSVKPLSKPRHAVMDLRQVMLKPAGGLNAGYIKPRR